MLLTLLGIRVRNSLTLFLVNGWVLDSFVISSNLGKNSSRNFLVEVYEIVDALWVDLVQLFLMKFG